MDKIFLDEVKQIVLKHLEDGKFGIDNLSFEMGFRKSQIWRRVK